VAPARGFLLYNTSFFVILTGLLFAHFQHSALPSATSSACFMNDTMGGGDGYRSVAYFVNVRSNSYNNCYIFVWQLQSREQSWEPRSFGVHLLFRFAAPETAPELRSPFSFQKFTVLIR
jgi:hypothetical protein